MDEPDEARAIIARLLEEPWLLDGPAPAPVENLHRPIATLLRATPATRLGVLRALDRTAIARDARPGGTIADRLGEMTVIDTPWGVVTMGKGMGRALSATLDLGPDCMHDGRRVVFHRTTTPEVLVTASVGRRLGELVTLADGHPLADARITGARTTETRFAVDLDIPTGTVEIDPDDPLGDRRTQPRTDRIRRAREADNPGCPPHNDQSTKGPCMPAIAIVSARFAATADELGDIGITGTRADGSEVLVGSVDEEFPNVAREIVQAMRGLGVEVDDGALPATADEPAIHFMTMRCTVGPDDSDWTDLETRSSLGKFPSASFAEEFDPIAEAVADLHPRPAPATGA